MNNTEERLHAYRLRWYLRMLKEEECSPSELHAWCTRWTDEAIAREVPLEYRDWVRDHRTTALVALVEHEKEKQ